MKRLTTILLVILSMFLLTSCEFVDSNIINETYKPHLHASPINGTWRLTEVLKSDSRYSFEEGDKFYFNIDFFATTEKIYLNPNFEIINVNWERYLAENVKVKELSNIFPEEKINVIEIKKDGLIVAEVFPINNDEVLLNISNELVKLERETDILTSEEKNELRLFYSEQEKVFRAGDTWALAIGLRHIVEDEQSNIPTYDYNTLLISFSGRGLKVDNLNGIIINNESHLDVYDVVRTNVDGGAIDRVFLNGEDLKIIDHNNERQSNIFRLTYISPRYATIEYMYPNIDKLNTLSTYTTLTRGGLNQLKIDDIVNYSTERVLDAINNSNSETNFNQAIYNIGMTRESGLTLLKGRVVSKSGDEKFNRDYILSSNFSYANEENLRRINYQELKNIFPDMIDVLVTPIDNELVIISKTGINIYRQDRVNREFEGLYGKNFSATTSVISTSWFNQGELENLEKDLMGFRVK